MRSKPSRVALKSGREESPVRKKNPTRRRRFAGDGDLGTHSTRRRHPASQTTERRSQESPSNSPPPCHPKPTKRQVPRQGGTAAAATVTGHRAQQTAIRVVRSLRCAAASAQRLATGRKDPKAHICTEQVACTEHESCREQTLQVPRGARVLDRKASLKTAGCEIGARSRCCLTASSAGHVEYQIGA